MMKMVTWTSTEYFRKKKDEGKVIMKSDASNGDEVGVNGVSSKEKSAVETGTTESMKE